MSKESMKDLLTLGFGIILYAMFYTMVEDSKELLPECKIYHESYGVCEQ